MIPALDLIGQPCERCGELEDDPSGDRTLWDVAAGLLCSQCFLGPREVTS